MRLTLALALALMTFANPALAHIGHIGEVAGHGHWIALGGIALAGAIALLGARKKKSEDSQTDADPEPEQEEAPA